MTAKDWEAFTENEEETKDAAELEKEAIDDLAEQEEELEHEIADIKKLEQAMLDAQQLASENQDKMLRALSELENTRRRAERDIEKAHKYSLEKFTQALIPVVDSLEQALDNIPAGDSHAEGIELTHKMMLDVLAKFSIVQICPIGEKFDPNQHEAMSMQVSDAEPGTVLEVFQRGYVLNERVVRPARVIVAKAE